MFLESLLSQDSFHAHKPDEKNRWSDGIRAQEAAGAYVPGIWRLFAWKPALAVHLSGLAQEVLRGPSTLSPGFREMIAAYVSTRNHCLFWTSAHAAVAGYLLKDRPLVDAVCRDVATAPISAKEKALFAYVRRLTLEPATCRKEHVVALTAIGWTDAEIFDAVTVTSLFGFFNRWIDGTGVADTPKGLYEGRLEQFGDRGYA